MRRLVVLQGVVGEVLAALGEHHAVDLHVRARADQGHVLVDLRQAAAQRADGPLERGVAADQCPLMGKMPNAGPPVLQVDVAQAGPGADVDFDRPAMQAAGDSPSGLAGLGQDGRLGALVQHDQRVAEIDAAGRKGRRTCTAVRSRRPWAHTSSVPPDQQAACSAANLSAR